MATVVQTPILQSALQGAAKGFALYFVPMTIVKRGVRHLSNAPACLPVCATRYGPNRREQVRADVVKRAASIAAFAATGS